jgi:hypothetical protein
VLELVVVVWDTFDGHFVDNVEIFSAGLVADVATVEWIHILVVVSCCSSYSVVMCKQLAFVLDLEDIQSYVVDN